VSEPTFLSGAATLREYGEDDANFVLDSWSKSFRVSPWAGVVLNCDWHATHSAVVRELLERGARVSVICARHNPRQILAWACWEVLPAGDFVLHYLYVKDPWRRTGLATALLGHLKGLHVTSEATRAHHTFRTRDWSHLDRAGAFRWTPEIARRAPPGRPRRPRLGG
jgi:GNAT superfamily N-acetyltransferase